MRNLILILVLYCVITNIYASDEGEKAPTFNAKLFSGQEVDNNTYRNQVLLINFWASWCEPCRNELPAIAEYEKRHFQDGFRVLSISMDDKSDLSKAQNIIKQFGFDNASIHNSDFQSFGRVWRIPLSYLIDRNGMIVKSEWYTNDGFTVNLLEKNVTPLLKR
ncbi:TlpA family protein disulfide reductase [Ferrovum sp. PN-J185]|uniref:TlpA disulfide reductase family protein n=1 Tax=Ferrovum sp. PN-J185 TaxID=1356306 RepID=UPI00079914F8|nr:TlpA disulfide reductase family protein [Ferrovum sp. PN-J185]KXW55182.1 thiol:disulfide interchange protein TlpA [Ferrovum sp. PN-J185]MCC6067988.1 TlpA family protein disulfide reductase [Ferrovum sp. PN-J185]MDE1892447.1 TlpA family protein disulfide reductase [Betaproteobacteria bacterium]MDE2056804.1 TlpA family protein disulfide reductase [Betaproteobacteria bacterium]